MVKLKGKAAEAAYEKAESAGELLRDTLGAPEHYKSEVQDATGKLQILTDAVVEIPEAEKVNVISVSQHPFGQEEIDRITKILFGDAKIYDYNSYTERTKEDWRLRLEELEGYVAAGNLDPYNEGTEPDGSYVYDIYKEIEWARQEYENAPVEASPEEVRPQYGLEVDMGMGETEIREDSFSGIAVTEDGKVYDYEIASWGPFPMQIRMKRLEDAEHTGLEQAEWSRFRDLEEGGLISGGEEEWKKDFTISLEEARQTADGMAEALGLSDMELVSWDYAVKFRNAENLQSGEGTKTGYLLHYGRVLDNVPVTYTMEEGGAYEDIDGVTQTWGYERLDFYVSDEGIDRMELKNQYDIGEVRTENVKLLPFTEIVKIYEKMMQVQNADVLNYEDSRTYRIDRIVFGYSRIYEPSTDSSQGILVPVWDFFGGFEVTGREGFTGQTEPGQSFLTINAVDGSVLDRGLGY